MLSIKRLTLILIALLSGSFSFFAVANDTHQAVQFKIGHSSQEYKATTIGYDVNNFVFYAKKNQRLKITLKTKSTKLWQVLLNSKLENIGDLNAYSADLNNKGEYILPYTGKYTLRIGQYRAFARRGESSHYQLLIAIH